MYIYSAEMFFEGRVKSGASNAVGTVISHFPKFVCVIQNVGVFTKGLLQALSCF